MDQKMNERRRILLAGASAVSMTVISSTAKGQGAFPNKPVRLVVPFAVGGTTDVVARLVAQKLADPWKQSVVVENKAGAGGNLGTAEIAKSPADGHHLVMISGSIATVNPHIYSKMPFDPAKDLIPIINVAQGPMIIAVNPNVKANNITELIALAKSKPGQMTFGSAGVGSQVHMAGENFLFNAGIEMNHVPYRGEGPALTDLAGGSIDMVAANMAAALPFVRTGRLRALGVTSAERSPAASELPTVAQAGLPGFVNYGWFAVMAPAGTPRDVVEKIQRDITQILGQADVKQRLLDLGLTAPGTTGSALVDAIRNESQNWARVVRERKIPTQ